MKKFKNLFANLFEGKIYRRKNHELKEKYKEIDSKKKRRDGQPKKRRCNCDRCQKGRQCRMNKKLDENSDSSITETISHEGNKYIIRSKKGKPLGEYPTKDEAVKRLRQIEWFKRHE